MWRGKGLLLLLWVALDRKDGLLVGTDSEGWGVVEVEVVLDDVQQKVKFCGWMVRLPVVERGGFPPAVAISLRVHVGVEKTATIFDVKVL